MILAFTCSTEIRFDDLFLFANLSSSAALLEKEVAIESVNSAFNQASQSELQGGGKMLKAMVWYDNEDCLKWLTI